MVYTRFAPSPTGFLHIGGARTALFSWLYARKHHGTFILRIEDTDRERSLPEYEQGILDAMTWLGLDYDLGPYYQTKRLARYKEVIDSMLASGKAYKCYCSKERLDKLREEQENTKQKPRYDGYCKEKSLNSDSSNSNNSDRAFVIRFNNPEQGVVSFVDEVHGKIEFANSELDDLVIARGDFIPTYNLAVVIDDVDMQVTHVIRGDDHINNTPRQINILSALGYGTPKYAHVPMILGPDGKRLSKRYGATNVLDFRDRGYLPEALLNYLVRLGWSHGDKEIFSKEEMIELFELGRINHTPAAYSEEKLLWVNQHYIKTLAPEYLAKHLEYQIKRLGYALELGPKLEDLVILQRDRAKTLVEMAENSRYFFLAEPEHYDEVAILTFMLPELKLALLELVDDLSKIELWDKGNIHTTIKKIAEKHGLKFPQIAQPIRIAVTGNTISPSVDATLELFGQNRALRCLKKLLKRVNFVA